jgi:hypothetical protein
MTDKDNDQIERDDSAAADDEMPVELLMQMLKRDDDAGEDVAFGVGSDKPDASAIDVVSVDDGIDLIDKAHAGKRAAVEVKVEPDEAPAEDAEKDAAPETALSPDSVDALLDGVPDARKAALRERLMAADEVLEVFKEHEAELQRHGVKPADAMKRLIDINAYASREPDAYLAWAALQLGDPKEILTSAAEKLGLKMVASASQDDDPFEDPEVKNLKAKLARYEEQERGPQLGPDSPQFKAQKELEQFAATSPHWQAVSPQIAALASTHVQITGKPATMDDIRRFYSAAVMANGLEQTGRPESTSAAQVPQPVSQQAQNKTAAKPSDSVQRAKAASKSLDGSGQGAGRRPELTDETPLEDVLRYFLSKQ